MFQTRVDEIPPLLRHFERRLVEAALAFDHLSELRRRGVVEAVPWQDHKMLGGMLEYVIESAREGKFVYAFSLIKSPDGSRLGLSMDTSGDPRQRYSPYPFRLFRIPGKEWSHPEVLAGNFHTQGGVTVPLLPLYQDGKPLPDARLREMGIIPVQDDKGKDVVVPLFTETLYVGDGIETSRRVAYLPTPGYLLATRSQRGLRVLKTGREKEAALGTGSVEKISFAAVRYKGVGALYGGRMVPSQQVHLKPGEEVLLPHLPPGTLVGERRLLNETGLFLDIGHQIHSHVPYGAAAPDDVSAIERDAAFLNEGAVMSVINLDAIALLDRSQVSSLTIPEIFVTVGVLLDTTMTLGAAVQNPQIYRKCITDFFKGTFEEARKSHLQTLCRNLGRNLRIAMDLGFTVKEKSTETRKDMSFFGGLKDTGELVEIAGKDPRDYAMIVGFWLADLMETVEVSGLSLIEFVEGGFVDLFFKSFLEGTDLQVKFLRESLLKAARGGKRYFATGMGRAVLDCWRRI